MDTVTRFWNELLSIEWGLREIVIGVLVVAVTLFVATWVIAIASLVLRLIFEIVISALLNIPASLGITGSVFLLVMLDSWNVISTALLFGSPLIGYLLNKYVWHPFLIKVLPKPPLYEGGNYGEWKMSFLQKLRFLVDKDITYSGKEVTIVTTSFK